MELMQYSGGALGCNGYLVIGAQGEGVAIDAPEGFADWALRHIPEGTRIAHLLITHQHFDHIQDAAALQRATGCTIHAAAAYKSEYTLARQAELWGIPAPVPFTVGEVLPAEQDSTLWLGGIEWRAMHVPGHSPDSVAWYAPQHGEIFSGDALFAGSVGRTDFLGGSARQLAESLRGKILILPPHTRVHPGHGSDTSVGEELLNNPFVTS